MGRPSKPLIEFDNVVEVAMNMIDEGGLDGLSMRNLGKRLGVNPASLYHHFRNKDEIVDAVSQRIVRINRPRAIFAMERWDERLLSLAKSFRSVILAHRDASMIAYTHNPKAARTAGHYLYEPVFEKLAEAGFSPEQSLIALITIEVLALGSALEESMTGGKIDFGDVDRNKYPRLFEVARSHKTTHRSIFPEMLRLFSLGLASEVKKNDAAVRRRRTGKRNSQ